MSLSIILAARGRPDLLRHTVAQTLANIREPDTKFVVAVDEDDTETVKAAQSLEGHTPCLQVSVRPREDSLGAKYNRVLEEATASAYLVMVDYAPHITPGFDTKILEAASVFPDNIGVVYNHMANLSFPQINAVTSGLVEKMGYLYPPYFPYWFVDHWLDDIAKLIDRIAVADVWIDTRNRPGTHDRRDVVFWGTFFDAAKIHRRRMAHSIIKSDDFQEPEWRKKLLLNHHPLIEERSQIINYGLRSENFRWHTPPEQVDERYRRVKSAAQALLKEWIPELEAEEATRLANHSVLAA